MTASSALLEHYRCPAEILKFGVAESLGASEGFFRFTPQVVCYGKADGTVHSIVNGNLEDISRRVRQSDGTVVLPFDADSVIKNLRYERYVSPSNGHRWVEQSWVKDLYYRLRPILPDSLRRSLQRIYLKGGDALPFPAWPVDRSSDVLLERLLVVGMKAAGVKRIPFVWFWPDGQKACAIVTHDVETTVGRDFCGPLMDIDDAYGVKSGFQIVPEKRYDVSADFLDSVRSRGFEVNIHGLNHEGNLFADRSSFLADAAKINEYAAKFNSRGFRSPVLYRNIDWFRDLNFSYDMSVPNVAHLEAQRGGCCTVLPYFLPGGMTELPLTATEDYTLFHMLNDFSMNLWKRQIETIRKGNGLISFIVHPDYLLTDAAQTAYRKLLEELATLRNGNELWLTLPRNVDQWWRNRSRMHIVREGQDWKIQGEGSEHARIAYACLEGDNLEYEIGPEAAR